MTAWPPAARAGWRSTSTPASIARPSSDHCAASASSSSRRSLRPSPERRRVDLDVVEAHDRVDDEAGEVHGLADDRAVDLALGRDVDHDVPEDVRRAAQPRARDQRPAAVVVALRRAGGGEVVGGRGDGVLGERAERRLHLATAADAPAAAHRVQVDTQLAGRVEDGRAGAHGAPPPGRHEDGDGGGGRLVAHGSRPAVLGAATGHGGSASLSAATGSQPPDAIRVRSRSVGNACVEPSRLCPGRGQRVAGDRERPTAPLGDVLVGGLLARHLRGPIDRLLEAVGQEHLVSLLAGAGVDLGRDVAPGDDDHLGSVPGHEDQARAERRAATRALAVSAATAASRQ